MSIPTVYPTGHDEAALLEPYTYISTRPGKEIRTELIESFNIWLQVPPKELVVITKVVTMLHTSSLLVDDIEDGSGLRQGEPVAHKIFGIPATINCANYVYFMALAELIKIPNPKMLAIFTQTGSLLRLAVKLMQEASHSEVDYVPLVELLGIHLQIRDDYMNLQSSQDSSELSILKQKPTEPELKHHAIKIMKSTNSFAYCRNKLTEYDNLTRQEIQRLGGNARLEMALDRLAIPEESEEGETTTTTGS
ncbi:geranylgeranyl pyrophosphate synthetase [Modicella reniformis]|uniref:Geranylgeranyl pyrophosphate synthetase n=1 Tax=Modicella reniformis TaxID=1440133 RepID=A0A9P6IP43_9FUNG|nr:geranylgeranyl pyrophosphate synthetase [Modicella reniformis]